MLKIGSTILQSRILLGTANYPSPQILLDAVKAAEAEVITVSLRRQNDNSANDFFNLLKQTHCQILPNTAGCFSAMEAVTLAQMAREIFQTNWIKLEVIGDEETLQPDPFELIKAAEILLHDGFEVLPYCTDELILCEKLVSLGCKILMPWAAPIGTGRGLLQIDNLKLLRRRFPTITLIIDAGIGKPSHAAAAMELGFDAVLLNTAVANAINPVKMAQAFAAAIRAGRDGFEAGLIPERQIAAPSSPVSGMPFRLPKILVGNE